MDLNPDTARTAVARALEAAFTNRLYDERDTWIYAADKALEVAWPIAVRATADAIADQIGALVDGYDEDDEAFSQAASIARSFGSTAQEGQKP